MDLLAWITSMYRSYTCCERQYRLHAWPRALARLVSVKHVCDVAMHAFDPIAAAVDGGR